MGALFTKPYANFLKKKFLTKHAISCKSLAENAQMQCGQGV